MWMAATWLVLGILIIILVFQVYLASNSLNNAVMLLYKQTFMLRETALLRIHHASKHAAKFHFDALTVPGVKGELLIRRFTLLVDYLNQYSGYDTPQLERIVERSKELDVQLTKYGIKLGPVTDLTVKMLVDIYHGRNEEALRVTENILGRIRRL